MNILPPTGNIIDRFRRLKFVIPVKQRKIFRLAKITLEKSPEV